MDNKGIFSIDLMFSIFILLLLISITFLFYGENNIKTSENIEINVGGRLLLDKIANNVNQVNSNGPGYSKIINLPNNISDKPYLITIKNEEVSLEFNNRKGISPIYPIFLINNENMRIHEVKLYNGENYLIEKNKDGEILIRND